MIKTLFNKKNYVFSHDITIESHENFISLFLCVNNHRKSNWTCGLPNK